MTTRPVIYVGIDGSWRDSGALEWALQESRFRQEPLHAVHVLEEQLRHAPYWEPAVVDQAASELVQEVQQYLLTKDGHVDHRAELTVGWPATTLADQAAGSELLVVGRRGAGAFKRLLIGSTSEAVANQAGIPVVVVPDGWQASDHSGPVLVGLDDSGENDAAVEFAVAAAIERQVPVRMVHVWDLPPMYSWDAVNVDQLAQDCARAAQQHFDEVAERWRHQYPELEIQLDISRGHPVESLTGAARATDAQLLVLGGHRRHKLAAMLLGSVARGGLQHASCPVAVVRVPGQAGPSVEGDGERSA
jgi:nucleotide-binding universal stress UspA family protein